MEQKEYVMEQKEYTRLSKEDLINENLFVDRML
jgi:hypothetical protein